MPWEQIVLSENGKTLRNNPVLSEHNKPISSGHIHSTIKKKMRTKQLNTIEQGLF